MRLHRVTWEYITLHSARRLHRIATQVTLKAKLGYMLIHTLGYTELQHDYMKLHSITLGYMSIQEAIVIHGVPGYM